jgi:hypothetical protein
VSADTVNYDPETGEILDSPTQPGPATPPPAQPTPPTPPPPPQTPPVKRRAKKKPARGNGAKHIPEDETPRERFLRSAATRMGQALTAIDLLASFGRSRGHYEYSEPDAVRMIGRLEDAIERMRRELARPPSRKEERESQRSFSW